MLASCDFNKNEEPFCNFQQDNTDNGDWTRHTGPTPTPGTGPDGDYPDGCEYNAKLINNNPVISH